MGISNSLFAALSGLNANQVKLNVISNNIANSNTTGFKATRSLFQPQFYVTDAAGSQPTGDSGGTNPSQRGLGVVVSALEKDFTQGSIETTGVATDLAIDGEGFFIASSAGETKFTRDGSFQLNSMNQLVTSTGVYIQGYGVDQNYQLVAGTLKNVVIPLNAATTAQPTSNAVLQGNLNANGETASGSSVIFGSSWTSLSGPPDPTTLLTDILDTDGAGVFTDGDVLTFTGDKGRQTLGTFDYTVTASSTLGDLMNFMQDSIGIDTTVPDDGIATTPPPGLSLETDLVDPNFARILIYGNSGKSNEIRLTDSSLKKADGTTPMSFITGTSQAGYANNPAGESVKTTFTVFDSLGTAVNLDVTMVKESQDSNGTYWSFYVNSPDNITGTGYSEIVGNGTLAFGTDGQLRASTGTQISVNRTGTGAESPLNIQLDLNQLTSYTSSKSSLAMSYQDGSAVGYLSGFSIGKDGLISGTFSNGVTRTLGQLAIATFTNPQGLLDIGGNMYLAGANSGDAIISTPGTMGVGNLVSGSLELSNVDLSKEFVSMIIASTGYSASSRVISTSDQMVQELLNTAR